MMFITLGVKLPFLRCEIFRDIRGKYTTNNAQVIFLWDFYILHP